MREREREEYMREIRIYIYEDMRESACERERRGEGERELFSWKTDFFLFHIRK